MKLNLNQNEFQVSVTKIPCYNVIAVFLFPLFLVGLEKNMFSQSSLIGYERRGSHMIFP